MFRILFQICEYPEPHYYRPMLLKSILTELTSEMESPSLDVDEEEMSDIFKCVSIFVMGRTIQTLTETLAAKSAAAEEEDTDTVDMEE